MHRVVVTGLGVICAVGNDKDTFWNSLITGKNGVGLIESFSVEGFSTKIAAQVKGFKAEDYVERKEARRMDAFVQFACAAARQAAEDAGLNITAANAHQVGVWIGSGIGALDVFEKQHAAFSKKGPAGVSPFFIPMLISNMAAGQVAIMLGCKGPNGCTVTACASGTNSIGEAFSFIRRGQAAVMLAGGTEAAITPLGMAGFCAMKAMSTRNEEPDKACRPFDKDRTGFVMGEGAGVLVLESLEHALERGAKIYGEIIGYGASSDAYHMVQPDPEGEGARLAFQMALQDAGLRPEAVDYINAHGTGTTLNDLMETEVIKTVFGEHSRRLLVTSTKPSTGHMLGAAGAVELIATLLAMRHSLVPPTRNLDQPDPLCDLDYVPGAARSCEIDVALSDSLGFGGHNAALIVRKYQ